MSAAIEIPRWLEIAADIDYRLFLLGELRRAVSDRSDLSYLIDVATGAEASWTADAERLMSEITELRREFDALT